MSLYSQFKKSLKNFVACREGNTSIFFAVAALPMIACVGCSVDYARYTNVQASMLASLDAAALAGAAAQNVTDNQRREIAQRAFDANFGAEYATTVSFTIEGGFFKSSAQADVPTSFMSLMGFSAMTVGATNEVNLLSNKKAEIALVLDFSGSMKDSIAGVPKYKSMQKAVADLLADLQKMDKGKAKVGIVPFSHQVYTSLPNGYVRGTTGPGTWTGCTVDRLSPYNTQATTPNPLDDSTKWGQNQYNDPSHSTACQPYVDNGLIVSPVSADLSTVASRVNKMKPYAWTHIALGTEFGYHLLTPNQPFGGDLTQLRDKLTQKYLVVLTDGMQTEYAYGGNGKQTVANGEKNLGTLCENAKADGITIVTVAFDLDDTTTRKRLQTCATGGAANFHVAESGTQLAAAFDAITNEITANIYLNK